MIFRHCTHTNGLRVLLRRCAGCDEGLALEYQKCTGAHGNPSVGGECAIEVVLLSNSVGCLEMLLECRIAFEAVFAFFGNHANYVG